MKKILLLSVVLVCLFITGCGSASKRLVCTRETTTVDVDMIMDWDNNGLSYLGVKYTMDLSTYSDAQIALAEKQDMCTSVKSAMTSSGYAEAFTNCKQKLEGTNLVINADFDIDKMPNAEIGRKSTREEAVTQFEAQGYTCK